MPRSSNLHRSRIFSGFLLRNNVIATESRWHHIILGTMHQPLPRPDHKLHRIRFPIMIRNLCRCPAQKLDNCIVTQMKRICLLQIDHPRQRHCRLHTALVRRQTKPKLTSGRMPDHSNPPQVELILPSILQQKLARRSHIRKCPRPASARVSHSPVLHIPRRDSLRCQCRAQMPHILKVVPSPPVPAVNANRQPMRPFSLRQPQIHKLISVPAVSHASIRPRRSQTQNVLRQSHSAGHLYAPFVPKNQDTSQ